MKKIVTLSLLIFYTSCQNRIKAKFEVTNNMDLSLDSFQVKPFNHNHISEFLELKPGETKMYFMDMTNLPKVDGEYLLTYKREGAGIKESMRFGYFTNGYPMEDTIKVIIESDTVIYNFVYNKK